MPFAALFDKWPWCADMCTAILERDLNICGVNFAPALAHYTPRYVKINYWPVGLLALMLKVFIVGYCVMKLFSTDEWAYSETPMGTVNAWSVDGLLPTSPWLSSVQNRSSLEWQHCNNEAHAIMYDEFFNYTTPACLRVLPSQLTRKGTSQVQVVTQFMEIQHIGWACADDANDERGQCAARRGRVIEMAGGEECVCVTQRTVYPIGVEKLPVSFEHTFEFPGEERLLHPDSHTRVRTDCYWHCRS